MAQDKLHVRYAGFWIRFVASIIDTIIVGLPLVYLVYIISNGNYLNITSLADAFKYAQAGNINMTMYYLNQNSNNSLFWEIVMEILLASVVTVFWKNFRGATPGKKMMGIHIVDAKTFQPITTSQAIVRFIGYIISTLPLCFGFIMIGLRKDKRGLHDLIAGTCVIYDEKKA